MELNHDPQQPVTQHGYNTASASGFPAEVPQFTPGWGEEAEGFWDASLSVFKLGLSWGKPGRVGHPTPLLGCNFHEGGDHLGPVHDPSPFDT